MSSRSSAKGEAELVRFGPKTWVALVALMLSVPASITGWHTQWVMPKVLLETRGQAQEIVDEAVDEHRQIPTHSGAATKDDLKHLMDKLEPLATQSSVDMVQQSVDHLRRDVDRLEKKVDKP